VVEYALLALRDNRPSTAVLARQAADSAQKAIDEVRDILATKTSATADEMTRRSRITTRAKSCTSLFKRIFGLWLSMPGTRGLKPLRRKTLFLKRKKMCPPCHATGPLRSGKMSLKPYFTMALLNQCVAVAGKVAGEIPLDPPMTWRSAEFRAEIGESRLRSAARG